MLTPSGKIVAASAAGIERARDLDGDAAVDIVFDMTDLTFMDSTGLTVLLMAVHGGHAVRLRRPTSIVRRIIKITGLDDTLPIEP